MDCLLADTRDTLAMITRLQRLLQSSRGETQQLVAAGQLAEVKCVLEETPSELLQLAGVCEDAEMYPDLPVGKAVIRRSQFLDQMLVRENHRPVFLALDEATQHAIGNRLLQEMARAADEHNPAHGLRLITTAIEHGEQLAWAAASIKDVLAGRESDRPSAPLITLTKPPSARLQGAV
jgi:hypothetical protein